MGSFLCLPSREACLRSSSLLCFLSSRTDECMGNGGPGLFEHSPTVGRLGLCLLDLEGKVFGSSALLARDRIEDLFLLSMTDLFSYLLPYPASVLRQTQLFNPVSSICPSSDSDPKSQRTEGVSIQSHLQLNVPRLSYGSTATVISTE